MSAERTLVAGVPLVFAPSAVDEVLQFLRDNKDALGVISGFVGTLGVLSGFVLWWAKRLRGKGNCENASPAPAQQGGDISGGNVLAGRSGIQTGDVSGQNVAIGGNVNIVAGPSAREIVEKLFEGAPVLQGGSMHDQMRGVMEHLGSLTAAVEAIQKRLLSVTSPSSLDKALKALETGDTAAAKALFRREAERAEHATQQAAKEAASAYRHLGALAFLDDTQEALEAYRKATQLDAENADGWNQYARLLDRVGDLDAAAIAYNRVLEIGEQSGDRRIVGIAFGNLGLVLKTRGDLDQAVACFEGALSVASDRDDKEGVASALGNLGNISQSRREFEQATEYLEGARALYEELGREEGLAATLGDLGLVYQSRGDLDRAAEYMGTALEIFRDLGCREDEAIALSNLGVVSQFRGDLDRAVTYYGEALEIDSKLGRKVGRAVNLSNLGLVHSKRGDLDQAAKYYTEALELDTSMSRRKGMAVNHRSLGNICQARGDLDGAAAHFETALELYGELGSLVEVMRIGQQLVALRLQR